MPKREKKVLRDYHGSFWYLSGYKLRGFYYVRMESGHIGIKQIDRMLTREERKALEDFGPRDRDAFIMAGLPSMMVASVQHREERRWAA